MGGIIRNVFCRNCESIYSTHALIDTPLIDCDLLSNFRKIRLKNRKFSIIDTLFFNKWYQLGHEYCIVH